MSKVTINTTADSLYFSRVLNLIGSIKRNYSANFDLCVWDKGLTGVQLSILKYIDVDVKKIEPFVDHWDECYSWKFYVYKHSASGIFIHLDAGNTVQSSLDSLINKVKESSYFLIDQEKTIGYTTPLSMIQRLNENVDIDSIVFAAGNIALNKNDRFIKNMIDDLYQAAIAGECLGYSVIELHRDLNGRNIVRDCSLFRHDQTVLNLIFRKYVPYPILHTYKKYAALSLDDEVVILNNRTWSYRYIRYVSNNVVVNHIILLYVLMFDMHFRVRRLFRRIVGL